MILLACLIHLTVPSISAAPLSEPLAEYGIQFSNANFAIVKNQKLTGKKIQHVIEAESPAGERIDIRIVGPLDETSATAAAAQESTALKKLYSAPSTPYMGDIAQAIGGCPSSLGPKRLAVQFLNFKSEAVLGAATTDHAFGACTREQARFKGAFFAYFDPATKMLWSWRIFEPWTHPNQTLNSKWLGPLLSQFKK